MTKRSWRRRLALGLTVTLAAYAAAAYLLLPAFWRTDDDRHPVALGEMVTRTGDGRPGDPLNIGIEAAPAGLMNAFGRADWRPADPITFETSVGIVGSVVFDRPDPDAPVSPLYYEGRREDLAFEKPVGSSADQRQHVRLWRLDREGEPFWIGAVTFDAGVSLSHYTGAVTHRIAPDIDAARDALVEDLDATGLVTRTYEIEGIGATQDGRNGEGDLYRTDGMATVVVLGEN